MKTDKITRIKFLASLIVLFVLMFDISLASATLKSNKTNNITRKAMLTYANAYKASAYNPLWYIPFTTPPITYTFEVSAERWATTLFTLSVNGESISGTESVISGSPVYIYDFNPVSNGSTVVVDVTGGSMPQQPIVLEGPFAAIEGVVNGSVITFSNVPLNNGYSSCGLIFN